MTKEKKKKRPEQITGGFLLSFVPFFFFFTTEIRGDFARYHKRYFYIEDVPENDDTLKSVDIFATGDYFTSLRL